SSRRPGVDGRSRLRSCCTWFPLRGSTGPATGCCLVRQPVFVPYSYAGNDPLHAIDPLGLAPISDDELREYADGLCKAQLLPDSAVQGGGLPTIRNTS